MNKSLKAIAVAVTMLVSAAAMAKQPVADTVSVIVTFKENTPFHQFEKLATYDERVRKNLATWGYVKRGVLGAVQRLERLHRIKATHVFSHAAEGFAVTLTPAQLEILKSEPTVESIEYDKPIKANAAQMVPWGVYKIGGMANSTRAGDKSGAIANVRAYVIDSGIGAGNTDLNAVSFINLRDSGTPFDCFGHGTHIAGIIGAKDNAVDIVGVAPGVKLHSVKVSDCKGHTTTSYLLAGIDHVAMRAIRPAVANISFGIAGDILITNAIKRLARRGVFVAIAAGNDARNACGTGYTTADDGAQNEGYSGHTQRYNGIMVVGASDGRNNEASFSSHGSCVSIWAPGVDIPSIQIGSNYKAEGVAWGSGTSYAAPHVAGAAAVLLSRYPKASPGQIESMIRQKAIDGGISKSGTRMRILDARSF